MPLDYTNQKLTFQIKKAARYIRLYGAQRTLIKIRGQYHMKKRYASLPAMVSLPEDGGHVGLIGCGNYAFGVIAYYLKRNFGRVLRGAGGRIAHGALRFEYRSSAIDSIPLESKRLQPASTSPRIFAILGGAR